MLYRGYGIPEIYEGEANIMIFNLFWRYPLLILFLEH